MATRQSNRARNRWTLDLLKLEPGEHVFELGCGPGFALSLAAKRVTRGFVTGVDHSRTMVGMARARMRSELDAGRVAIIEGDETRLGDFNASLDAIYSANVVQFLNDPGRYFALALNALKPGGRIATTYQPRGSNPSRRQAQTFADACCEAMDKAGFGGFRCEWLEEGKGPGVVCIVGRKPA